MGKALTKKDAQAVIDEIYGVGTYCIQRLYRTANRDLKVQMKCCKCNSFYEFGYKHVRKGSTQCLCSSATGLREMAKRYAKELYIEPYDGLIVGDDLGEFILTCLMYDMPQMRKNEEFVEMIENYLLEIYEEKGATRCKRCGKYYPRSVIKKDICRGCRKGMI